MASTMGFTAVDGLPMGTRCGAIDPGVILYLMDQRGMDARAIEKLIYNQSGLLGVSGVSSDMRTLLASKEPRAALAITAAWLGVALDEVANQAGGPRISTAASATTAWVLPTNEELMIARHTRRVLGS